MMPLDRQHLSEDATGQTGWKALLDLGVLVGAGLLLGGALWWLNGPPQIPSEAPDLDRLRRILTSSEVANDDVIYVASGVGWLALAYLAFTISLRLLIGAATRLADGSAWTAAALRLSDFVTLPAVRRVVDGALVAVVLIGLWTRQRPGLEASPAPDGHVVGASAAIEAASGIAGIGPALQEGQQVGVPLANGHISYSVARGESLWGIARRLYGDGTQYVAIFRANEGRVMNTGETFTDPRLIRPGWSLDAPLPGLNVWAASENLMYRVQPGDSLWRISESFLGDGFRWLEVWQLNQGRTMADGRPFSDPDLIFPGWVLELPVEAKADGSTPAPEWTPPAPSATPSPVETAAPGPLAETEPTAGATAEPGQPAGNGGGSGLPWPGERTVLATAAGLVGAGASVLMVRALLKRVGERQVSDRMPVNRPKRASGDAGRVVLAARALAAGLADFGFDDARIVLVREAPRYYEFFMECGTGDAEALLRSRYDLGRRLACGVDGKVESPTRIRLKLSRFQRMAGLLVDAASLPEPLTLVPVGVGEGGVHYLNLAAAGSTLVSGTPNETRQLLSAWASTLTATCRPDEVALLTAGGVDRPRGDAGLLAQTGADDTSEERQVEDLVRELEEMLVARETAATSTRHSAVVALVRLPGGWEGAFDRLETVLRHGPEQAIYVSAAVEGSAEDEVDGAVGARVVFGAAAGSPDFAAANGYELMLAVARHPPVWLQPVGVRTQIIQPPEEEIGLEQESIGQAEDWGQSPDEREWEGRLEEADLTYAEEEDEPLDGEPPDGIEPLESDEPSESDLHAALGDEEDDQVDSLTEESVQEDEEGASNSPVPQFSVRCLGAFEVTAAGGEVAGWTIHKARELLAYLIARRGAPVPREEVVEALWPEGLPTQVDHLLSNAAYYVRRTIRGVVGEDSDVQVMLTAGQRYHLQAGLFRVDADAFDAHLRRAEDLAGREALVEYERALALYKGDFLGSEPYEWAAPFRREFLLRFLDAAQRAASLALDCRDTTKAVWFYRAILERDPTNEEAARGLMRCYDKLADPNGVRKVYKVLTEALRRELEDEKAEPLPETTALLEELTRRTVQGRLLND